jgi:hypothetical protein
MLPSARRLRLAVGGCGRDDHSVSFMQRYLRGERDQVWADLRNLGSSVRHDGVLDDARSVASETMRRVRDNVEILRRRLDDTGYLFKHPSRAHIPPDTDVEARLDRFEEQHGPLPVSLRAFYEVVGTVDFRQSWDQLVQWHERERRSEPTDPVEYLGEYDPLMVEPLIDTQLLAGNKSVHVRLRRLACGGAQAVTDQVHYRVRSDS